MSELDPKQWLRVLPDVARLAWGIARDKRVPLPLRVGLGALVAYVALPVDIVPDWVPFAGQLDDALVFLVGIRQILRRVPEPILEERWPGELDVLGRLIGKELGQAEARPGLPDIDL